ncbi:MAG: GntR family transcriptional regulator [Tissierella sp.]|nr:GntR family transcriptional regulator [Tissierella sp.]
MNKTLNQKVYETIIDSIITGKFDQSTVISENELVQSLGVSRSPVREALVRLCNNDILYSIPRFGYKLKIADHKYLEEIIQFRLIMEPAYLEKFFDKLTEVDIQSIEEKIVTMNKDEFSTPSEYWEKTSRFHIELAYSYRDQYFYDMLKQVLDKQWITFSMLYWNNWSSVVDSKLINNHLEILKAIKAGNKEEAVNMLKKDIRSF